jgi:hypothetical protein
MIALLSSKGLRKPISSVCFRAEFERFNIEPASSFDFANSRGLRQRGVRRNQRRLQPANDQRGDGMIALDAKAHQFVAGFFLLTVGIA